LLKRAVRAVCIKVSIPPVFFSCILTIWRMTLYLPTAATYMFDNFHLNMICVLGENHCNKKIFI
jgi:hypothetical protein